LDAKRAVVRPDARHDLRASGSGVTQSTMRTAALDVGDVRIGVAVSDELGITATGIGVVRRKGGQHDLEALATLLAPYRPYQLVVGLPITLRGEEGPRAAKVRAFATRAAAHLGVPVDFIDESFTTVEAERVLLEADVSRRKRRRVVDKVAATIILQAYLATRGRT
jgi:putative Holliday junction resolvase